MVARGHHRRRLTLAPGGARTWAPSLPTATGSLAATIVASCSRERSVRESRSRGCQRPPDRPRGHHRRL